MREYPRWQFWKLLGTKKVIQNLERDKASKEVQIARAYILEAKMLKSNHQYYQFLTVVHRQLETGRIKPNHVKELMRQAKNGEEPTTLTLALLQLTSPTN